MCGDMDTAAWTNTSEGACTARARMCWKTCAKACACTCAQTRACTCVCKKACACMLTRSGFVHAGHLQPLLLPLIVPNEHIPLAVWRVPLGEGPALSLALRLALGIAHPPLAIASIVQTTIATWHNRVQKVATIEC